MPREARTLALVWMALMALLAATVTATFAPIAAPLKTLANLVIAGAKAGLIAWVFMHLREQTGLNRIAALAAVGWLTILISMTLLDVGTRTPN